MLNQLFQPKQYESPIDAFTAFEEAYNAYRSATSQYRGLLSLQKAIIDKDDSLASFALETLDATIAIDAPEDISLESIDTAIAKVKSKIKNTYEDMWLWLSKVKAKSSTSFKVQHKQAGDLLAKLRKMDNVKEEDVTVSGQGPKWLQIDGKASSDLVKDYKTFIELLNLFSSKKHLKAIEGIISSGDFTNTKTTKQTVANAIAEHIKVTGSKTSYVPPTFSTPKGKVAYATEPTLGGFRLITTTEKGPDGIVKYIGCQGFRNAAKTYANAGKTFKASKRAELTKLLTLIAESTQGVLQVKTSYFEIVSLAIKEIAAIIDKKMEGYESHEAGMTIMEGLFFDLDELAIHPMKLAYSSLDVCNKALLEYVRKHI